MSLRRPWSSRFFGAFCLALGAAIIVVVYGPLACAAMFIAVFLGVLFVLDALAVDRRR